MAGGTAGTAAPAGPSSRVLEALPVAVDAALDHDRLIRYLEGELGWQVVDPEDPVLPVRLHLVGSASPSGAGAAGARVLLLDAADPVADVAAAVARLAPEASLVWPDDRHRLAPVVAGLLDRPRVPAAATTTVSIGGAAGGVGVTTVSLAVAAILAWNRVDTLAVLRPPSPVPAPPQPREVLRSSRLVAAAGEVPGVEGLRAIAVVGPPVGPDDLGEVATGVVVIDRGTELDADVLLARRDRAGLAAMADTVAPVVVVHDDGAAPWAAVREAAAGRRVLTVPRSVRIARADLRGRGPAGYPGAWLRALTPVAALARGPTR